MKNSQNKARIIKERLFDDNISLT